MIKKTILITGCSSGFGHESTFELARRGHKVIATVRRHESVEILKKEASENNLVIECFKLDITNPDDRKKVLNYDPDVLVNNAGVGEAGPLSEIDVNKVRHNFEVNVFSTLELSQLVLKKMIEKDFGTVIFVSSLAGRVPIPFLAPYSMTKFALSSAASAIRRELRRISNIKISVVEPGGYLTGFNQEVRNTKYEWLDENSKYSNIINDLKKEDETFKMYETRSIKEVINKIVSAAESPNPRFRYTAPWWQGLGVHLLRTLGR